MTSSDLRPHRPIMQRLLSVISDVDVVIDVTGHCESDWCIIGVLVLQLYHTSVQNKRKTFLFSFKQAML